MTEFFSDSQAVTRDIPNAIVEQSPLGYMAEYGVRTTDNALVIHLFPLPKEDEETKAPSVWGSIEMTKRLDAALPKAFDTERVTAGYEAEYDSFFIIAGGYGNVPDPRGLARRFLSLVDAQ